MVLTDIKPFSFTLEIVYLINRVVGLVTGPSLFQIGSQNPMTLHWCRKRGRGPDVLLESLVSSEPDLK